MDRNAHYALVGLVSMVLFIAAVVFVVWLARLQLSREYAIYDVDFKGPVRGLSSGGGVFFNGIKVGEVTRLSLDPRDPNRVVARIRTRADAPVRVDSTASLEPQGITGVNYIQITAGVLSKSLLRDATSPDQVPVIHSQRSQIEDLLQGGGDVLSRTVDTLNRVNQLLSDANISTISQTLTNLKSDTALIGDQRALLVDLDATLKSVQSTSERIGRLSDNTNQLVGADGRRLLTNLNGATTDLRGATEDVRGMISALRGPTAQFASTGLPQLSSTIITLQTAAEDLDRVVTEVERNPRQLLSKSAAKELQVAP